MLKNASSSYSCYHALHSIVVMGDLALRYIPVSLMPIIAVLPITVQANLPDNSAHEIDRNVLFPLRFQVMRVSGVKNIRSESKMDVAFSKPSVQIVDFFILYKKKESLPDCPINAAIPMVSTEDNPLVVLGNIVS